VIIFFILRVRVILPIQSIIITAFKQDLWFNRSLESLAVLENLADKKNSTVEVELKKLANPGYVIGSIY